MALLLCKSVVLMVILVSSISLAMAEGEGPGCGEGGDCLKLYTQADVMQNDGTDAPIKDEAFPMTGSVTSAIFTMTLSLKHEGIPAFTCSGKASGLYTPGIGPLLNAQLTTPNSYDMVSRATSFRFTGTFVLFLIKLLDGSAELGSITAAGITTLIGTGGGSISCQFT